MENNSFSYAGAMPKTTGELVKWYAGQTREEAIEPELPIIDPHLHIFGTEGDPQYYRIEDYVHDLSGGHAINKTVYIEAYRSNWRTTGPEHLRSVGELEAIINKTKVPLSTRQGACEFAAGIVANIDLTLGAAVVETLDAHQVAGQGRLRGVRQVAAYDDGLVGSFIKAPPRAGLMLDPQFRSGFAKLKDYGLSFDVWIYHHQLAQLISLVDASPETTFILNHLGGLIGVGAYGEDRHNTYAAWKANLQKLSERSNVYVKVGGMGMPVFGFNFEHQRRPASSEEMATAWRPLIDICLSTFGPTRCMFESNYPVDRQSGGYTEIWNALKRATRSLSPTERHALFYETASQAYRLG